MIEEDGYEFNDRNGVAWVKKITFGPEVPTAGAPVIAGLLTHETSSRRGLSSGTATRRSRGNRGPARTSQHTTRRGWRWGIIPATAWEDTATGMRWIDATHQGEDGFVNRRIVR